MKFLCYLDIVFYSKKVGRIIGHEKLNLYYRDLKLIWLTWIIAFKKIFLTVTFEIEFIILKLNMIFTKNLTSLCTFTFSSHNSKSVLAIQNKFIKRHIQLLVKNNLSLCQSHKVAFRQWLVFFCFVLFCIFYFGIPKCSLTGSNFFYQ